MPLSFKAILLVEDNESDVALTRRALLKNRIDAPLVVAWDGVEALDYLLGRGSYSARDTREQPALVLLDLKLPKLDGLSVLERIRREPQTSRTPVVILTSSLEEQDLSRAYDLGVNSYVRKPVNYDEFAVAMGQLGTYWLQTNQAPPKERVP